MGADLEGTVRAFFDAWALRDPDVLTSYFAEDGEWSEANREAARGHDALRAVFEVQVGFGSDFTFEFRSLVVAGDTVFTERVDRFVINGAPMTVPVAGVMEFDATGKIRSWRDYYDWSDLERQLVATGIDTSGAHG